MTTRKMLDKEVNDLDLDGYSLEAAMNIIANLISNYGKDAMIEKTTYSYSDREYLGVFVKVPETDEQMKIRLALEKLQKDAKEQQERDLMETLKKKYGG